MEQNLLAQDNIIRALTEANANYGEVRRVTMENKLKRNEILNSLIYSFRTYEDLVQKCNKGIDFYKKLDINVSKLLQRIRSTIKVQNEEREQKMSRFMPKSSFGPSPSMPGNFAPSSAEATSCHPKLKDFLNIAKNSPNAPGFCNNINSVATSNVPQSYPGFSSAAPGPGAFSDSHTGNFQSQEPPTIPNSVSGKVGTPGIKTAPNQFNQFQMPNAPGAMQGPMPYSNPSGTASNNSSVPQPSSYNYFGQPSAFKSPAGANSQAPQQNFPQEYASNSILSSTSANSYGGSTAVAGYSAPPTQSTPYYNSSMYVSPTNPSQSQQPNRYAPYTYNYGQNKPPATQNNPDQPVANQHNQSLANQYNSNQSPANQYNSNQSPANQYNQPPAYQNQPSSSQYSENQPSNVKIPSLQNYAASSSAIQTPKQQNFSPNPQIYSPSSQNASSVSYAAPFYSSQYGYTSAYPTYSTSQTQYGSGSQQSTGTGNGPQPVYLLGAQGSISATNSAHPQPGYNNVSPNIANNQYNPDFSSRVYGNNQQQHTTIITPQGGFSYASSGSAGPANNAAQAPGPYYQYSPQTYDPNAANSQQTNQLQQTNQTRQEQSNTAYPTTSNMQAAPQVEVKVAAKIPKTNFDLLSEIDVNAPSVEPLAPILTTSSTSVTSQQEVSTGQNLNAIVTAASSSVSQVDLL